MAGPRRTRAKEAKRLDQNVLGFEVAPETLRRLRRAAGGNLDNDATLMARQVLAGDVQPLGHRLSRDANAAIAAPVEESLRYQHDRPW